VRLEPGSPLLAELARGWGQAWGIFLTSDAPAKVVRARLRRLTRVEVDGSPRAAYFRFYDPRVLRVLMPIATPRQASWFFGDGEIGAYLVEDRDPRAALMFTEGSGGAVEGRRFVLDGEEEGMRAGAR
jgi:hypothetical protein